MASDAIVDGVMHIEDFKKHVIATKLDNLTDKAAVEQVCVCMCVYVCTGEGGGACARGGLYVCDVCSRTNACILCARGGAHRQSDEGAERARE